MTIKEIIPVMPMYSDGSGYDVVINVPVNGRPRYVWDEMLLDKAIELDSELLNREVDYVTAGKNIVGGSFNESLQIWIKEE